MTKILKKVQLSIIIRKLTIICLCSWHFSCMSAQTYVTLDIVQQRYMDAENVIPISSYGFKIKMSVVPKKQKNYTIDCFNLDEFRKQKVQDQDDKKVDLV